ncbi:hypothetical protein DNTS_007901 [Danionella cerebrum]|uniref:Shisa N-terminal domain-containing protein n=1 Tax=Danionella cerebrum TaxID=2873325 RepID=A0A553R3B7_9TELE|nr:hypothetical protein DNTS_007901 [Danionella translucida]
MTIDSKLCVPRGPISREERRMKSAGLLLGYFLMKVLVCDAEGEPGNSLDGLVTAPGSNDSRDAESKLSESPHTEDRCRGYYDVMGQWDPPFVCRTGSYLYCCGTCGFRFCCEFKNSRLDQTTCKNYDTPPWSMTGRPPPKMMDQHDPTKDKTNLIVYIVCGVVAIMALVGIFTKLGLEKAHRPHRENMSRALAQVMRQTAPGELLEREESLAIHGQPYESLSSRASGNNLKGFNHRDYRGSEHETGSERNEREGRVWEMAGELALCNRVCTERPIH